MYLEKLKLLSREEGLLISPVGVGSAFAKKNAQSSFIVAKNGMALLVDIGTTIPGALYDLGVKVTDFDYYHFTHSHADHIGGVEELFLMSRYVAKKMPKVIITADYQRILWEHSLKGGCEYNECGLLRFSDFAEPVRPSWMSERPREMYSLYIEEMKMNIIFFRTKHISGRSS